jgi:hypothetical protein
MLQNNHASWLHNIIEILSFAFIILDVRAKDLNKGGYLMHLRQETQLCV